MIRATMAALLFSLSALLAGAAEPSDAFNGWRGNGTGLGLRICRRILEEMGGRISASNRDEGGARFEILLPVHGA